MVSIRILCSPPLQDAEPFMTFIGTFSQ